MCSQLVGDALATVHAINEMSLRQMIVPGRLLGRVNASMSFLVQGIAPVGALVAGAIASVASPRAALGIAVAGIIAAALIQVFSPIRHLQTHPEQAAEAVTV
jgi:hypothetical protein